MAGNQVPNNIEDPTILKRFLTDLVSGLNSNPYYSGNVSALQEAMTSVLFRSTPTMDFLNAVNTVNQLRTDILKYIEDNLETVVLQNQEDVALIVEQFGAFYDKALAASWYGLSVKAGGAIAGLEIGSLDPDVTTPGDESSYFRVIADNFIVGRAYEDLSAEEKAYLASEGLPAFGTVYNEDKVPVPALIITWDSVNKLYKHYFNGIVNFVNVENSSGVTLEQSLGVIGSSLSTLEETNDGVVNSFYQTSAPTSGMSYGDWWVDTDSSPTKAYRYEDVNGKSTGTKAWRDNSTNIVGKAYISALGAQETADGKISTFYSTSTPTAGGVGDLWINSTTNITYRWSSSMWNIVDTAIAINNGSTTIHGGKVTTNTLGANTLTPSTGASTTWAGGGLVSQNFNGNAAGSIGSPTLGFRLSSNAAGTSADPTIYGAYIKGATLEGTSLTINDVKVKAAGYSLNFGDLLILKTYHLSEARPPITSFTLFSDTYIARSYSSGYNALRMCATTQVFEITCTLNCDSAYIKNLYLHYSTDGTNYTLLDSVQNSSNTSIVLISKSHYHSTTNHITFKVSGDTYYGGSGTNWQNLLLSLSVKSTNNSG